jgi:nucleoside-diphosphate-sugar epimerase
VQRRLIPVVPDHPRLVFQAVHSYDVGDAYRLAVVNEDAQGPFNVAADPVLDPGELARVLGARKLRVPGGLLRGGAALTYLLRLQPSEPGWVDMALAVPVLDATRARTELGWRPQRSSTEALLDLLEGMREGAGLETPPLEPGGAGALRIREFASGVGARLDAPGARSPAKR